MNRQLFHNGENWMHKYSLNINKFEKYKLLYFLFEYSVYLITMNISMANPVNVLQDYRGIFDEFAIIPFITALPAAGNDEQQPVKAVFQSAAQYIHIAKALLFGDLETAEALYATAGNPAEIVRIASGIKDFDYDVWKTWQHDVYMDAMRAKVDVDGEAFFALLDTGDRTIVEPRDPNNMCGIALMDLRTELFNSM